ncbi:MAG: peptide MFS transporter [Burkholderiales bacterium]|nr:peptide MFS transporter [Burkholderiales bacterium]
MLFLTEMWERFSYYGMRALLVIYLVNAQGYERANALALYATYTGLVYLSPLLGGYLADRYLGRRKAILIGGFTMALGHFAMAFEPLLHLALGLLIIGNGFFKPNIGTLLGSLYREHDPRRDGGFTFFYMGVNTGAFLAPLVAGTLGEKIGWHYGFAAAGVGMCLGLAQFVHGQKKLGNAGFIGDKTSLDKSDWLHILLIAGGMVPLVLAILSAWTFIGPVWDPLPLLGKLAVVAGIIGALWFSGKASGKEQTAQAMTRDEWLRIAAILIMGFFVIFFWMGFEQAGGTMSLFADKLTDRHLGDWEIPASYFQAINPLSIVILGPVLAAFWTRLDQTRFALSSPAKMGFGLIFLGLGFLVMAIAQDRANVSGTVGPHWLAMVFVIHTIGELCLSPVGLSMVTKLAPTRVAAMMMGVWYLANAAANKLAGILEELLKGTDFKLFWFLVVSSLSAGILLLLISPLIKKMMGNKG